MKKQPKAKAKAALAKGPSGTVATTEGFPAEDWEIRRAFASLMDRCAAEDIEGDIARHETKGVFFEMLDAIFQAAQKNPKLKGPAWAGRLMAEVLSALEKRSPDLEGNPAFTARRNKLKSFRIPSSPLWPWIVRAYQRMNFVVEWDCGLHPLAQISSAEQGIPAVLDRIQGMGGDKASREMFEKIVWPILDSWKSEITTQPWFDSLARHAKGDERNPTLPNLKPEFMRVWKVFINRPEGRLTRIERPQ